jgi:hypothetical protein
MEQIAPYTEQFLLPAGYTLPVYAADQAHLGYEPLSSIKTPDGKVASQWRPTPEELAALNAGQPITLIVWTFNAPLQPVCLGVGGMDLR